ncbi:MAG TPA: hypothetical protein VJ203_06495 [Bacteroidales bacterium]|nr:hypothetical protein [Bacteroidales bacterium]
MIIVVIALVVKRFFKHFAFVFPLIIFIEMVSAANLNNYYTTISTTRPKEINEFMASQPKGFPIPDNSSIHENTDENLTHSPLWRNMGILTKRISYDGFSSFILRNFNYVDDSLPNLRDSLLYNPPVYLSGNVKKNSELRNPAIFFNRKNLFVSDSIFYKLPVCLKGNHFNDKVGIISFDPNRIKIRYETDSVSIITYLQAEYRGWQVKIDGVEVPHFVSNHLYISAVAPPGNHEVVFEYKNKLTIVFFIISYSTFVFLLLILIYLRFKTISLFKSSLLSVIVVIAVILLLFSFFHGKSMNKIKEETYNTFSDSIAHWNIGIPIKSIEFIFNFDDTFKFNQLIKTHQTPSVNYFRFHESNNTGDFYRLIHSCEANYLVYGFNNMYNPPETEIIIRERFPFQVKKVVLSSGSMAMFSRSGIGETLKVNFSSINEFETPSKGWSADPARYDSTFAFSGNYCEKMDSGKIYSSTFREGINVITGNKDLYLAISADVFLTGNGCPFLIYAVNDGEHTKNRMSFDVRKFVRYSNRWGKVYFMVRTGKRYSINDTVSIYFWNKDKSSFYIDNFRIEGYLINESDSK